jgi:hypothetical protein
MITRRSYPEVLQPFAYRRQAARAPPEPGAAAPQSSARGSTVHGGIVERRVDPAGPPPPRPQPATHPSHDDKELCMTRSNTTLALCQGGGGVRAGGNVRAARPAKRRSRLSR